MGTNWPKPVGHEANKSILEEIEELRNRTPVIQKRKTKLLATYKDITRNILGRGIWKRKKRRGSPRGKIIEDVIKIVGCQSYLELHICEANCCIEYTYVDSELNRVEALNIDFSNFRTWLNYIFLFLFRSFCQLIKSAEK